MEMKMQRTIYLSFFSESTEKITSSLGDKILVAIHKLLVILWTMYHHPTAALLFPDPTIQFVIHSQLCLSGAFKDPSYVTGILAKLTWLMVG